MSFVIFKPVQILTTIIQPRYVSRVTTILTGLHGICLLTVTTWFIYQLKRKTFWAEWVMTIVMPITRIASWVIMSGIMCIRTCIAWTRTEVERMTTITILKLVRRPYQKYKENLHLQRNIFWYFHLLLYFHI